MTSEKIQEWTPIAVLKAFTALQSNHQLCNVRKCSLIVESYGLERHMSASFQMFNICISDRYNKMTTFCTEKIRHVNVFGHFIQTAESKWFLFQISRTNWCPLPPVSNYHLNKFNLLIIITLFMCYIKFSSVHQHIISSF